jgi:hypothetical protein
MSLFVCFCPRGRSEADGVQQPRADVFLTTRALPSSGRSHERKAAVEVEASKLEERNPSQKNVAVHGPSQEKKRRLALGIAQPIATQLAAALARLLAEARLYSLVSETRLSGVVAQEGLSGAGGGGGGVRAVWWCWGR